MTGATEGSRAGLLDAARMLVPRVVSASDEIERTQRLPAELLDTLHEHGLFRMLLPRSLNGWETDPLTFIQVIEMLAGADASTAWCVGQACGCTFIAAYLDHERGQQIFGRDPRAVLAWGQSKDARAVAVPGGYRVTANWQFASGSHHATWLGGYSPIVEADGSPRQLPSGAPETRMMLFPASDAELLDVWQVSGLRGTGSDTIHAEELFVPHELTGRVAPEERRERGPLYMFPWGNMYAAGFASVALGVSRAMLDSFVELASGKKRSGSSSALRENAVIQRQVALSEAMLGSGRAYLHSTLSEIWSDVTHTGVLKIEQRMRIRLASTFASRQAIEAADTVYHAAGSSTMISGNPFERRFRDIHAVSQQVQARQSHFETVGAFLLGLEPDLTFL